ncbi:MAG: glycine zipper 2TM domain-containing protein [Cellvibrionaceae bacterium]
MNKLITALVLLAVSSTALADRNRHVDYARVTDARPIYESYTRKVPYEECHVETVRYDRDSGAYRSATGTILGGVIGAAVGNKLGHKKRNKQVGAVAGAVLGASIGRDISHRNNEHHTVSEYRDVERCTTRYRHESEQRLVGYDVSYRYHGSEYRTTMDRHPGDRIKVAVSVDPVY